MRSLISVASGASATWPLHNNLSSPVRQVDHDHISALGDEISNRLFLAGLDLCSALGLVKNEAARERLEQAVSELDDSIKDLRLLMLAVTAQADPAD
jgi:hypothetical protein